MDLTITIKGADYSVTYEFEDIEFLVQFLAAVKTTMATEFPYVVGLAAEQENGKMVFNDDLYGG